MPRIGQNLKDVTEEDMERKRWAAVPTGDYIGHIIESDYKPTRNQDGMVLKLIVELLDERHKGRKIYTYLTLEHPKSDTVKIAKAALKSCAIACGHSSPDFVENSEDLHRRPMLVSVKRVQDATYGDEDGWKNEIFGFQPPNATPRSQPEEPDRYETDTALPDDDIPF